MKKLISTSIVVFLMAIMNVSCSSKNDDVTINQSELSTDSNTFLATYFKGIEISRIEKDVNSVNEYYEVYLANGTQVDFTQAGEWTDVDGNGKAIPTGFILSNIIETVSSKYPNIAIEGIQKVSEGFEVDLLNGVELLFDKGGNYLRVKD
ncbi:MAG: PepSY-like domain-containing protein [Capnocytophaga sp.]|nr:PepSY-like domain-containing protein [Capnocytophaga sp.]